MQREVGIRKNESETGISPHVGTASVSVRTPANSGISPHVGTDPVSVRTLTRKDEICYAVGRPNWHVGIDTGSVPTCGRSARVGVSI